MFDISKLNQGSFRGVPFYTKKTDNSSGHRLTNHKFINSGTQTEDNGLNEDTYNIECFVIGDNYLTDKENLKQALDKIGAGTLIDRFYGELNVYVDSYSISESKTEYGQAKFNIKFVKEANKPITKKQSLVVQDLQDDSVSNFKQNFNNKLGESALQEITQNVQSYLKDVNSSISFINNSSTEINNAKNQIENASSGASKNISSIENLANDITSLTGSFDSIFQSDSFDKEKQIQFQNSLYENLKNTDVASDDPVSKEINKSTFVYASTVTIILNQKSIQNLENIEFDTGDEFGSIKDSSLELYELIEEKLSEDAETNSDITQTSNTLNFLDNLKTQRTQYITFYTEKYSRLQDLESEKVVSTVDLYSFTMAKYQDINRIDEVMTNNELIDPLFVAGEIKALKK